jgi:hypothetical protein
MHEVMFTKILFSKSSSFQVVAVRDAEQRKNAALEGLHSDMNEHVVAHVTER